MTSVRLLRSSLSSTGAVTKGSRPRWDSGRVQHCHEPPCWRRPSRRDSRRGRGCDGQTRQHAEENTRHAGATPEAAAALAQRITIDTDVPGLKLLRAQLDVLNRRVLRSKRSRQCEFAARHDQLSRKRRNCRPYDRRGRSTSLQGQRRPANPRPFEARGFVLNHDAAAVLPRSRRSCRHSREDHPHHSGRRSWEKHVRRPATFDPRRPCRRRDLRLLRRRQVSLSAHLPPPASGRARSNLL